MKDSYDFENGLRTALDPAQHILRCGSRNMEVLNSLKKKSVNLRSRTPTNFIHVQLQL
jgi:hypothetical protein